MEMFAERTLKIGIPLMAVVWALGTGSPARAHHSSALVYDRGRVAEVEGTITRVIWANPHVRFELRGASPGGVEKLWAIESNSVSTVSRFGLTADLVTAGTRVKLAGNPGRQADDVLWVTNMLLPSGAEILFGAGIEPIWSKRTVGGDVRSAVASGSGRRDFFRTWTNVTFPPEFWGNDLPLTPAAAATKARFDPVADEPTKHCTPKGMPFVMEQPYPMEIVDAGAAILLRLEEYDTVRRIELAAAPAERAAARSILGTSVGRWDGDALVVTTTNIDYAWFNGTGIPQGPDVAIEERFALNADASRLDYTLTVSDPVTFTEPVTLRKAWEWRPGEQVRPYECRP
jgi:Family of unknown function (DUF6152)